MLATGAIKVPKPLGFGSLPDDGGSYIILEHLNFQPFGMVSGQTLDLSCLFTPRNAFLLKSLKGWQYYERPSHFYRPISFSLACNGGTTCF
jgi:hypothetical protein